MNKEFIPYEQSLEMKELGFDMESIYVFNGKGQLISREHDEPATNQFFSSIGLSSHCIAPLYQQAFRWFRERYRLDHTIHKHIHKVEKYVALVSGALENYSITEHNTYEEAELACLRKLIEIVKNK